MGIFDEEEKKMADEIAAAERQQAEQMARLGQLAHKVSQDLITYLANRPRPRGPDIDIGVHENRITLRKRTTSNTMEIVCTGRGIFEIRVDGDPHVANQSTMARSVLGWVNP